LSAIEILLLGAARVQKGLPQGSPLGQARHATRSLRRIKMIPSGGSVAAAAKTTERWGSLISAGSEIGAATSKTKRE
jgi:hypothetical protein